MDAGKIDIAIIGAGMAGLACGTRLAAEGFAVTVFDKGRGPGGRMAARRAEIDGNTVSFDHGAQYFTARDARFQQAVIAWHKKGAVSLWNSATKSKDDPAFVGTPGMNGPIRVMAQQLTSAGGEVRWGTRVESLARSAQGWLIGLEEYTIEANTVLCAIPAEQTRDLLEMAAPDYAAVASEVRSDPCWAVMAAFAEALPIDTDCVRDAKQRIAWAARNSAKPQRNALSAEGDCWVLHASTSRSREVINMSKDQAASVLLDDFFAQIGVPPIEPVHLTAHRWLYAKPNAIAGESARFDPETRIGIAGDYLHSPRVEGAWVSGNALAERVLSAQ